MPIVVAVMAFGQSKNGYDVYYKSDIPQPVITWRQGGGGNQVQVIVGRMYHIVPEVFFLFHGRIEVLFPAGTFYGERNRVPV